MSGGPTESTGPGPFEFAALSEAGNYRAAVLREFTPWLRGTVIEIGAGIGQFTTQLCALPAVQMLVAVEPNPGFCLALRRVLPDQPIIQGTSEAVAANRWADAVVSINVLEHIADDERELCRYRQLLKPAAGRLCLFVPARPEIYSPLDRDFGHYRRYTRRQLAGKLERAQFHVRRMNYFNVAGYFAWWLNFCVRRRRQFNRNAVRFFDRRIFPAVYWLESRWGFHPLGQSLIAMAEAR